MLIFLYFFLFSSKPGHDASAVSVDLHGGLSEGGFGLGGAGSRGEMLSTAKAQKHWPPPIRWPAVCQIKGRHEQGLSDTSITINSWQIPVMASLTGCWLLIISSSQQHGSNAQNTCAAGEYMMMGRAPMSAVVLSGPSLQLAQMMSWMWNRCDKLIFCLAACKHALSRLTLVTDPVCLQANCQHPH